MGLPGWREDFDDAGNGIAEQSDTLSQSTIVTYKYDAVFRGYCLPTTRYCAEIERGVADGGTVERRHRSWC